MPRSHNQHTIETVAQLHGRGYWSGQAITVRFLPAPVDAGIRFVRTDLPSKPSVLALANFRESMSLRTVLSGDDGATVSMVEHLLAALFALGIDNCTIEVDAQEMPGLDGSAAPFTEALCKAGICDQQNPRSAILVDQVVRIGTAASWIEASPSPSGLLEVEYQLDYGDQCPIRPQTARYAVTRESFRYELAPARTFVTADQAEQLRTSGVASHVTPQDLLIFGEDGLIGNTLLFDDECSRHKAMDMVGDLALTGCRLIGRFVSHRGGHELNASMAKKLQAMYRAENLHRRKIA